MPIETYLVSRRGFLGSALLGTVGSKLLPSRSNASDGPTSRKDSPNSLKNEIGFTTGSLSHQRTHKVFTALTLPKFVRDELGMQMTDFNTNWLTSFKPKYID